MLRRSRPPALVAPLLALLLLALLLLAPAALASTALQRTLGGELKRAGSGASAYVVDLTSGAPLFSARAATPRLPASVEKLYTTSTALLRFGPNATLTTRVYGVGTLQGHTWVGTLYLRGGGDPSFGASSFDSAAYGGGTTVQRLVQNLRSATGIDAVSGRIVGDESYLDSVRGTPATSNRPDLEVEGQLSGLVYDRGFTSTAENAFQPRPALSAAQAFAEALRAGGIAVPKSTAVYTGRTPVGAQLLTIVHSPRIATLVKWTNTASDNFLAEMLLKDLGARFGGAGTTAAGVTVVAAEVAKEFGVSPSFDDGSGLSYADHTTAIQVEALLAKLAADTSFTDSLAVAGETGTLEHEMNGTVAQGRCRGKTGTLAAVSNLVGYCTAANGDTLVFAFLMNSINPDVAHPIQDAMAEALAAY
jgi:D-alanyl-D-alanine carboxypeptidase/D-alanyl-D-alanine-endopeptidase (penicillin-binding protein 4)